MPTKFYAKEIPESPIFINGHGLRFDFMETEDSMLIAELDKCVARGVGGVMSITQEQYSEEIKKKELSASLNGSLKPQQRQEISALRLDARRVVEAVANPAPRAGMFAKPQIPTDQLANGRVSQPMPEPIEVPTPESFVVMRPPTAKIGKSKA